MQVFLEKLQTPEVLAMYEDLDATWDARAAALNQRLQHAGLPVRVANLQTVWTVQYTEPSRHNWMLQFYLRAEGLALSWVGTGRFIFSLNYTAEDFQAVSDRFLRAAERMRDDGWWWHQPGLTNQRIRRGVLREMFRHRH